MSASIADYYDGVYHQSEYVQALSKEGGHFYRGTMKARRYEFHGVPTALAFTEGDPTTHTVTVTDIDGVTTHDVPMQAKVVDGSQGYAIFISEEVKITRTPIGYHMYNVAVEHLTGVLS